MSLNVQMDNLLDDEHNAVALAQRVGLDRVHSALTKVSEHMNRRAAKYNARRTYFDYEHTAINVAHDRELTLMRGLKVAIMLCDVTQTPQAARLRNLKRMATRKAKRETEKEKEKRWH